MTSTTAKSPGERQVRRILLGLITAVPFLIAILALLDGWEVLGDNAIIGIRVRNLLGGDLPLTGLPSTGQNFGTGIESSHPGPLALYALVPFVVLFGQTAGMALGAAAINAGSFALAAWAGYRRGGVFLMAVVGFVLCVLARGLSPWTLVDPLSSNLGTFPSVAFALAAWAVLEGDRRLLPFAIVVGSFTFQAHLTYMAFGAGVSAVLLVGLVVQVMRDRATAPDRRTLVWSGLAAGVLWLPVLLDQFFGGGNISSIIRTFTESGGDPGMGWSFALRRLVHAVAVPPFFGQDVRGLDFLARTPLLGALLAIPVVLFVAFRTWRTRGRALNLTMFVIVTAGVGLVSVYSAAQLPSGATVKAANLRWMWTFGALWWTTVVWAAVGAILDRIGRPRPERIVPVLFGATVVGMAIVLMAAQTRPARDARAFTVAAELRAEADEVPRGDYRIRYSGNQALLTVGPSFAYALRSSGSRVYVDAGLFGRGYGSGAIFTGQEVDLTYLVIAGPSGEIGVPDGYEVIFSTSYREGNETIETMLATIEGGVDPARDPLVAAFCEQTEPIDQRVQAAVAQLGAGADGASIPAGEAADVIEDLGLDELDPDQAPEEVGAAMRGLIDRHDETIAELRAAGEVPVLDVLDPQVMTEMMAILDYWLKKCPS